MSVQERADFEFALALQNDDQLDTDANPEQEDRELTAQEILGLEIATALQNEEDHQEATHRVVDEDLPPETHECACGEVYDWRDFPNVVWLEYRHLRCPPCFNENVRVGLGARKNFPPRCCPGVPINIELYKAFLQPDVKQRYEALKTEYTDIAPVYCATKSCSVYLPKATITPDYRWAVCSACTASSNSLMSASPKSTDSTPSSLDAESTAPPTAPPTSPLEIRTCTACLHLESDHDPTIPSMCPDRIDRMDKDLFTKRGWKSCPSCQEMIEKSDGCDHMQCDCGHEFCYKCRRSYEGGMPCNCHGGNAWVDEVDEEENDPDMQRQILEGIAGGNGDGQEQDEVPDVAAGWGVPFHNEDNAWGDEEEEEELGDQTGEVAEIGTAGSHEVGDANAANNAGHGLPHADFVLGGRGGFGHVRGNFRGPGDVLGRGRGRGRGRGWTDPVSAPTEPVGRGSCSRSYLSTQKSVVVSSRTCPFQRNKGGEAAYSNKLPSSVKLFMLMSVSYILVSEGALVNMEWLDNGHG